VDGRMTVNNNDGSDRGLIEVLSQHSPWRC
jgi:hypothetical protein